MKNRLVVSRVYSYTYPMKLHLIFLLLAMCLNSFLFGNEYFVSKSGNDSNEGTVEKPFLTISKAAAVMQAGDLCYVGDGIYSETVRPQNSGNLNAPISFKKLNPNGKVVISGVDVISRDRWEQVSETQFKASVEMPLDHENQVFLGDQMLFEARWPNTGNVLLEPTLATMEADTTKALIVDSNLPDYDYTDAEVWIHAKYYWSNWTTFITSNPNQGELEIIDTAPFHPGRRHVAAEGADYYVFGIKDALDADNEWYYDDQEKALYVSRNDGELPLGNYYTKQRMVALDLRDRAHIHFEGIDVFAATIETDASSYRLVLDRMQLLYPYFSSRAKNSGSQGDKGVRMLGKECIIKNSEIAYSSGTGVALFGEGNQILNCYIHDHDFIGTYASCVQLGGKGNVISHSTLTRSGRSVIDYRAMYQALIQYCDMSHAGMLTSDLGLTYGNVIEGGNSVVRYNLLRNNDGSHYNMGLYYDHGTQNIISHHNIVYGVNYSGFQLNQYASYHLVYNNTFISSRYGFRNVWGNQYDPELNGVRFANNVFSNTAETAASNYHWSHNLTEYDGFDTSSPFKVDESLLGRGKYLEGISEVEEGVRPGLGALETPDSAFKVGHDFENPPVIDTTRSKPLHRNLIVNSAFEHEDNLSPWKAVGEVEKISHGLKEQMHEDTWEGRMGRHSIKLSAAGSEVYQEISGFEPNATYQFIAYLRVDSEEQAIIGVRYADGSQFQSPHVTFGAPGWRRVNLSFDTYNADEAITVFVKRQSDGEGSVFLDDTGLVLVSK